MRYLFFWIASGFVLIMPMASLAQSERYDACLAQVQEQPLAAYEYGLDWQSSGGGAPSLHCIASALMAMGDLRRAADRLEDLGYAPDLMNDRIRADIFTQASEVLLQIGQPERALKSSEAGLKLAANDAELRLQQARAFDALGKNEQATKELDRILRDQPDHLLALRLRATSLIRQNKLDAAGHDVRRAMGLAGTDVDVLLLRGEYREAKRLAAKH